MGENVIRQAEVKLTHEADMTRKTQTPATARRRKLVRLFDRLKPKYQGRAVEFLELLADLQEDVLEDIRQGLRARVHDEAADLD